MNDKDIQRVQERCGGLAESVLDLLAVRPCAVAAVDGIGDEARRRACLHLSAYRVDPVAYNHRGEQGVVVGEVLRPRRRIVTRHQHGREPIWD